MSDDYDRLAQMISDQHDLQLRADPRIHGTIEEQLAYFKDMILACTDELHEALAETGWKPWATKRYIERVPAFHELRDAWQFLTNAMLVVTQDNPRDLAAMLHVSLVEKHAVNHQRLESGTYDGILGKCEMCKRDLSEVTLDERIHDGVVDLLCPCGMLVATRPV